MIAPTITPLPWRVSAPYFIRALDGAPVAHVYGEHGSANPDDPVAAINAAFIVAAVNAYGSLFVELRYVAACLSDVDACDVRAVAQHVAETIARMEGSQ